jgi:hypothetical protein
MGLCHLLLCTRLIALRGGGDDLSADGDIAQRIRAELAAHEPLPDSRFAVAQTSDGRRATPAAIPPRYHHRAMP